MKEADRLSRSGSKEELLQALRRTDRLGKEDDGEVLVARLDRLLASHLPTNYDRWLEVSEPYRIM